jgi:hypothetical protein
LIDRDELCCWQRLRPASAIDVSADGRDRRMKGQRREHRQFPDVACMNDLLATAQRVDRLRP